MMHENFKLSSGRGELTLNAGQDCGYISITVLGVGFTMALGPKQIDQLRDELEKLRRDIGSA
jgi:hypothetical protein